MTPRENALRIIKFNHPEYVMEGSPDWCLSYHGVDHEAIFVHEVQALKRGREFGATHQQSARRGLLQRRHRPGQVPFDVMRVAPGEVAARRRDDVLGLGFELLRPVPLRPRAGINDFAGMGFLGRRSGV